MQFRKRIRSQMYFGASMLVCIVVALSAAGIHGALSFRKLTKDIRARAFELPLAARLAQEVSDLRVAFSNIDSPRDFSPELNDTFRDPIFWASEFQFLINKVSMALDNYEHQLEQVATHVSSELSGSGPERESVCRMRDILAWLGESTHGSWMYDGALRDAIDQRLGEFQALAGELPAYMKQRMEAFAESSRAEYHTWITISTAMMLGAIGLVLVLAFRFHSRVFRPLETLVRGSRRVARGEYDHRISVPTDDEVAELAAAMNAMTRNFQEIKQDLNRQVQQRTAEVVQSEKMASVGFLAAGVAHEINNPLASIAWSAESLEMRIADILGADTPESEDDESEIADLKKYLRRIQDEAFRCKGITSSLLDYSRLGEARKEPTDLNHLIESVIEIVRPLSRYRERQIVVRSNLAAPAMVDGQEIKQVVLNLITNALDSVDAGGEVLVELDDQHGHAVIAVTDNGCGMTPDVLDNIFEPFFTRKKDGQGTGLGLSITFRIVEEHGGTITAYSEGVGKGSRFTVTLPLVHHDEKELQAA